MDEFVTAVDAASVEYERDYRPIYEALKKEREEKVLADQEKQLERLRIDLATDTASSSAQSGGRGGMEGRVKAPVERPPPQRLPEDALMYLNPGGVNEDEDDETMNTIDDNDDDSFVRSVAGKIKEETKNAAGMI